MDGLSQETVIIGFVLYHFEIILNRIILYLEIGQLSLDAFDGGDKPGIVRFQESNIKSDYLGAGIRKLGNELGDYRPGPDPFALLGQAFFVDDRQYNLRTGGDLGPGLETDVDGFQIHEVKKKDSAHVRKDA